MRLSIIRFISSTLSCLHFYRRLENSDKSPRTPAVKLQAARPYAGEDADGLSCQRSVQYAYLDLRWSDNILWLPLSSYLKDTEFCKTCRDFIKKTDRHTFALSNEKRSCRPMDRTLAYEAWNWGSSPHRNTKWSFGRSGICAGLKILRTWFDSTRLHNMVAIVQLVRTLDCGSRSHGFDSRSSP